MSIYDGCQVEIELPQRDSTKDISEILTAEFPGIEIKFLKSAVAKRASVKSFYLPKGHVLDGATEIDENGSNVRDVSRQGLFLAAEHALKNVPAYYYVRIMDYSPPGFDYTNLKAYLRITSWKDVALGHGQMYGVIKTPESLAKVFFKLGNYLFPDDMVAVDGIYPYDGPCDEVGVMARLKNSPVSEMKRVRDFILAR